jgi:hypothetical protein
LDVGLHAVARDKGDGAVLGFGLDHLPAADVGEGLHVQKGWDRHPPGGVGKVRSKVDAIENVVAQERSEQVWVRGKLAVERRIVEEGHGIVAWREQRHALGVAKNIINELLRREPGREGRQGGALGGQDIQEGLRESAPSAR